MASSSAASPRRCAATPFVPKGVSVLRFSRFPIPDSRFPIPYSLVPAYFEPPKLYTRLVVNRLSMCLVPGTIFEL